MEKKDVLISIIIPVYNVEKFINKCLTTVTRQTYKNIEIILVDDGSKDDSGKICNQWAKIDNRIKVIHKINGGLSDSRNTGLKSCTGQLVCFIDSDDYLDIDMIEKLYNTLAINQADMVICDFYFEDEEEQNVYGYTRVLENEVLDAEGALKKLVTSNNFYYVTAVNRLYKKELFTAIQFPNGKIHEDEYTAHLIISKCKKIVTIKDKLYHYIQRSDSITHNTFTIKKIDAVYALLDRFYFFKKNNLKKEAYFSLIQAYSLMLTVISNIPIYENNKIIRNTLIELIKNLKFNLRSFKLLLVYNKKRFTEYGGMIKFFIRTGLSMLRNKKCEKIIFMGTPTHGNLGDQAIVYSEYKLMHKYFPNKKILEVYSVDYLRHKNWIQKRVSKNDVIVIDGGGNLGSLWPNEDDKITDIVSRFSENTIIIFPQTCYYDSSSNSKIRIEKNKKIFDNCPRLHLMLRDLSSYQLVNTYFPNIKKYYVPDVVLKIEDLQYNFNRNGILLCFREDHEKVVTDQNIQLLKEFLNDNKIPYEYTSTVINQTVLKNNRMDILNKKWEEFAKAKLIITDRLHGMIFAAITSTPCIALDNRSKKVSGVYQWIKDVSYIKCKEDFNDIYSEINAMYNINNEQYLLNSSTDEFEVVISNIIDTNNK